MIYSSDADPDELLYGSRIQIQGKRSNFVILGSWVWICIKITRIHITFLNMYKNQFTFSCLSFCAVLIQLGHPALQECAEEA